jgi:hypothetical protein
MNPLYIALPGAIKNNLLVDVVTPQKRGTAALSP